MKFRENLKKIATYSVGFTEQQIKEKYGIDKIVKLNANENPYGASKNILSKLSNIDNISRYPDADAIELREKISQKYNLDIDEVVIGNGGDEIIEMLCQIMLNKDDEIIMCTPGFSMYKIMAYVQDANVKSVPLKEYKTDLDGIIKQITDKTKMIFITNPHNPTGTIITQIELENFLKQISSDILVVIDEAYAEFVKNDNFPNSIELLNKYNNICILRTFSKAYGLAGMRTGYLLADKTIINEINKIRPPYNVNSVSQKLASFAIDDTEWLNECVKRNNEVLNKVYENLNRLNVKYVKTDANFLFISTEFDSNYVYEELLKQGYMTRAGYQKPMDKFLRISIGTEQEMDGFIKALENIICKESIENAK